MAIDRRGGGVWLLLAVLLLCLVAPASVLAQRANTLTLTKTTTTPTFMAVGDVLHYQYDIKNDGPDAIPSGSSVFVSDDKVDLLGSVSCRAIMGDLAVGDSVQCVGSYTVTAADVTAGKVTNTAQANIDVCGDGCYVYSNTARATSVLVEGSISLEKSTSTPTFTKAGDVLSYSYLVTNTGSTTITDQVSISDNRISSVSCPAPGAGLLPGNSITCTGSDVVTASDVSGRSVTNTASASAGLLVSNKDSVTVNLVAAPALELDKTTSTASYTSVGDSLDYGYLVTNSGNTTLSGAITITDDRIGSFTCATPASLAPGSSVSCSRSDTAVQADIDAGSVTNTAQAFNGATSSNKDSVTITANQSPALTLDKTTSTASYAAVGDTLNYAYLVTNAGNTTLTGTITVSDNRISAVACPALPAGGLLPGKSITCSGADTASQADIDAGSITNTATASNGKLKSNQDSVTVRATLSPALKLTKRTSTPTFAHVGDTLKYSYRVKNSGNTTLTGVISVSDNRIASVHCPALPASGLIPGKSITCHAHDTVAAADVTAGSVTNIAIAQIGTVLSNKDRVTVQRNNDLIVAETRQKVKQFLYRRLDLILSQEPDRNRFIRRLTGSLWGDSGSTTALMAPVTGLPVDFTLGDQPGQRGLSFSTSLSQMVAAARNVEAHRGNKADATHALAIDSPQTRKSDFDVWAEGHITFFDDSLGNADFSGHLGILYLGADYLVSPSVLIGALVQFDWFKEDSSVLNVNGDGFGWMAGPYLSVKLSPNLYFDARGAWGRSNNNIDPYGFYTDNFDTSRWLVHAGLTGNWNAGNWRFTPSAAVSYMQEQQNSFTNKLGLSIPSQTVAEGQLSFGPEVAYRFLLEDGTSIEPHASIQGVWSFARPDSLVLGNTVASTDAFRARVEGGILMQTPGGTGFRASVEYDGIGSSLDAITGKLWLSIPLN